MPAELSFRAMGSGAHVTVVDPSGARARALAEYARDRIIALEERWSRFLPTSELSHVSDCGGTFTC